MAQAVNSACIVGGFRQRGSQGDMDTRKDCEHVSASIQDVTFMNHNVNLSPSATYPPK